VRILADRRGHLDLDDVAAGVTYHDAVVKVRFMTPSMRWIVTMSTA